VRSILKRELYRGVETWNRSQKRDKWGVQKQTARPVAEWITCELPELRIVDGAAWSAMQARFAGRRGSVDTTTGPRAIVRRDLESAYLLSGFGRCATCGWSMTIVTRQHGNTRKPFLGCLSHHKRGPHVCTNAQMVPLEKVDLAVLMAVQATALAKERSCSAPSTTCSVGSSRQTSTRSWRPFSCNAQRSSRRLRASRLPSKPVADSNR
jgi:hypothetical protein